MRMRPYYEDDLDREGCGCHRDGPWFVWCETHWAEVEALLDASTTPNGATP